jgi:aspartate racemase
MKILGMIGGTGPESTVEYYRRLIATYHARVLESGAPPVIINSVDNKDLVKWFTAHDLAPVINFLAAEIDGSHARALISR